MAKDGQKIRKLMDDADISQSKLGRLFEPTTVTPTSVGRYLDALDDGTIKPEQWRALAKALRRAGLEPEQVRPVPPPAEGRLRPDLLPLIDRFDRPQLEALKLLIEAEEAHPFVLFVISERLK